MKEEVVTFVLFGGTGDLTRRKLVPAFGQLVHDGKISRNSTIIGISRKKLLDEEYKKSLIDSVSDKDKKRHVKILRIKALSADFAEKGGLDELKTEMDKCEIGGKCNRIYYLATSFKFFPNIVRELRRYGLDKQKSGFTRVVFEKPFGEDLKSAVKLDKGIHEVFSEGDVFRIDHYLAKETVKNLNILKFTNPILYSTFNNKFVDSIEITVDEAIGVGNRVEYYDDAGAIKDMIQNHLLQVLSLILMERPLKLESKRIHNEKVKILKNIEVLGAGHHLLGQYKSYEMKDSRTETFARIVLNCKTKQWDGVKLVLRTGKRLKRKYGQIRINFKAIPEDFINDLEGVRDNKIVIDIYPRQDVTIWMNTRNPLVYGKTESAKFEFCRECEFGPNTSDEYATLLEEVIKGDKTLFTRSDEVKESWRIVDKIEKMKKRIKFVRYRDGGDPED